MLSSAAPAKYTLLPHTSGICPIGYDFVILFLNKQFDTKTTQLPPPPVVNVSKCLEFANLRTLLGRQSRAQSWHSEAVGEFHLYSRGQSESNMVSVDVWYSKEQREVRRFCDEIDSYNQHQRLNYSLTTYTSDSWSFSGAPIVYHHEGRRYLLGISNRDQVVTSYGIFHLLAGIATH